MVHCVTHFAYITGCDPIILIGVDLKIKDGKRYCNQTTYTKKLDWGNRIPPLNVGFDEAFTGWKKIKELNNVNILNLSSESRLTEIFPTIGTDKIYND